MDGLESHPVHFSFCMNFLHRFWRSLGWIVGASGSGKTTLMNIIGVLDRPTEGEYLLDGVDVAKARN